MLEFVAELFENFPEVMIKTVIIKPYLWFKAVVLQR
jgi:hypothetical protein